MATATLQPTFLRDVLGDELEITASSVDAYFAEQWRKKAFKPAGHISNSSHYSCFFSTQAPRLGMPIDEGSDKFDDNSRYSAAYGDAVHDVLQEKLWDADLTIKGGQWKPDNIEKKEVSFGKHNLSPEKFGLFEEMDYSLRADNFAQFGDMVAIGEFKSKAGYYFGDDNRALSYYNEALLEAEMQLQMALGFAELDFGFMIFVNRELNAGERIPEGGSIKLTDYRVYSVEFDKEYFDFRCNQIKIVAKDVRAGVVPLPDNLAGTCNFCKVKSKCPVPKNMRNSYASRWYPGIEDDEKMRKFLKRA